MNTNWSDYIQSTEELYASRSNRFRDDNAGTWLPFLYVKPNARIMEIGCAGGSLLHRVKQLVPSVTAEGLDRDDAHIAFAKKKSAELGLDCEFTVGDATAMPFADDTFDLTFSHTVIEHVPTLPFLREQLRVLKPGGRIVVWSARTSLNINPENWKPTSGDEQRLLDKLWEAVDIKLDKELGVAQYELKAEQFPKKLEEAGFAEVDVQFFALANYTPDNFSTARERAESQINTNRMHALSSVEKAYRRVPDALTTDELTELRRLINKRYDERISLLREGEKLWDVAMGTVLSVTGVKK